MIELEDFSEDIIGKAMRGLAITPPQLSHTYWHIFCARQVAMP